MTKTIAFFDFDGTITERDTFIDFMQYTHGKLGFYFGFALHAPILILFLLKLYPNDKTKQVILRWFYKGWDAEKLYQKGREFCANKVPTVIRPKAQKKIDWHRENGHQVVIVTASCDAWVNPWAEAVGLEIISTGMQKVDGKITGNIEGENCWGPQKVTLIKQRYDLSKYDNIYAYGDTSGDKPMLALADEAHYKPFRD